jgi:hypothetical protein
MENATGALSFDFLGVGLASFVVGVVFGALVIWLMRNQNTRLRRSGPSPYEKTKKPQFETRIIRQGKVFFIEKRYLGPFSFQMLFTGNWPNKWVAFYNDSFTTLEQAREAKQTAELRLGSVFSESVVVEE